jgi:hypothetical protein
MSQTIIAAQFAGPPTSGNGGYVAGILARAIEGPATAVLRAAIPLDTPLNLTGEDGRWTMTGADGGLIGEAFAASAADLPDPPPAPSLAAAEAASRRYLGLTQTYHPICFSCATSRGEGDGLRVFAGQLEGAEPGVLAAAWTPHPSFAGAGGTIPSEIVWAALDCAGWYAWLVKDGTVAGLLGTMTGEVLRAPRAGEPHIVMAWPIEGGSGRKRFSGVALYTRDGECIARGRQVWIAVNSPG